MVGLAVHVGGYALGSSVTTEPLVLVADLLYVLGYALWIGVVVAVFVQVFPEATVVAGELPSPRQVLPPLSRELPRLRLQLDTPRPGANAAATSRRRGGAG